VNTTAPDSARLFDARAIYYLLFGIAAAALGLLPWLVTGLTLPLQNLWNVDTLPADMPRTLLPFSQYAVTLIVGLIVVGSAIAGGIARARGERPSRDWR